MLLGVTLNLLCTMLLGGYRSELRNKIKADATNASHCIFYNGAYSMKLHMFRYSIYNNKINAIRLF